MSAQSENDVPIEEKLQLLQLFTGKIIIHYTRKFNGEMWQDDIKRKCDYLRTMFLELPLPNELITLVSIEE